MTDDWKARSEKGTGNINRQVKPGRVSREKKGGV